MRLAHSTDSFPIKSDPWSHKHLTPSKGGGPPGINALCKAAGWQPWWEERRWGRRFHFKVAVAGGKMGARDDDLDLDGEFVEDEEEVEWDEFCASLQEDGE
ncbi:hypothetical protein VE03_08999 [Pseudogymnoascus sp. 23342-1-I1]|nr:hypothetical protein VE03_08999 [Pseudogymnoascus sp. 23342-1-I1]